MCSSFARLARTGRGPCPDLRSACFGPLDPVGEAHEPSVPAKAARRSRAVHSLSLPRFAGLPACSESACRASADRWSTPPRAFPARSSDTCVFPASLRRCRLEFQPARRRWSYTRDLGAPVLAAKSRISRACSSGIAAKIPDQPLNHLVTERLRAMDGGHDHSPVRRCRPSSGLRRSLRRAEEGGGQPGDRCSGPSRISLLDALD